MYNAEKVMTQTPSYLEKQVSENAVHKMKGNALPGLSDRKFPSKAVSAFQYT